MSKQPTLDEQIEQKKKELELLGLQKREAELKAEIEKLQHTKVEETIIMVRTVYRDEYVPNYIPAPLPIWPNKYPYWINYTQGTTLENKALCANTLNN